MPKYTDKQALFAKIYLLTGDARRAYKEAGYKSKSPDKVLKTPGVQSALAELRKKQKNYATKSSEGGPDKMDISRDDVLFSLAELRDRAMKKGNYQTALKAITEISRLLGYYDTKKKAAGEQESKQPAKPPVKLLLKKGPGPG